jgi:putative Holliday junction resolvase
MSRYLGIDYGSKRIGVAVGESTSRIASPVATVEGKPRLADQLEVVLRYADAFVVGLPLNMDDSEGPQAKVTRAFGDELAKRSGQPVHYFDERLSSAAADELLEPAQLSRKKRRVRQDRVAAQVILQAFLETL